MARHRTHSIAFKRQVAQEFLAGEALREAGYLAISGQLVDATTVSAPKQRNTKAEKRALKEGRIPEDWQVKPAKLRQKDRDARLSLQRPR